MKKFAIGADIGGSHITCQLFDLHQNKPVEKLVVRKSVNSQASKDEIIDAWANALQKLILSIEVNDLAGIGFAMPGPFDYENGIAWFKGVQKFDHLYGINIREELQQKLHLSEEISIRFLNDASCFAIGESWMGVASGYKRIIALTLGTGFGTTFLKNGIPVAGEDGVPEDGFLYHIPFEKSIADDYFSTRWFINEYLERSGNKVSGVKELANKAITDAECREIFQVFGGNLGSFLSPWVNQFNADCIVLGGNISKSLSLFKYELEESLKSDGLNIPVLLSGLEESAALTGSAKLCDDVYYKQFSTKN